MSLENATIVDAPPVGQSAATTDDTSNDLDTRHAGILDMDAQEPGVSDNPDAEIEQEPAPEGEETTEETQADPWDGYEDYDLDGEIVKIPAKAKEYLLRQADYTRKTQAVAEQAKQLQAKEEQLTRRYQQSEEEFNARVALTNIDAQLKAFEGFDWNAEAQKVADDPIARIDLQDKWRQFQDLRSVQQQVHGYLNSAAQQRTEQAQQATVKRLQETREFAEKIKGWTPQLDEEITTWADKELGFDRNTLIGAYTPQVYKVLHDAYQWNQSLKRQQTARPSPQASPPTPTKTVSAKASPSPFSSPESARSMEEYVRARAAGKL